MSSPAANNNNNNAAINNGNNNDAGNNNGNNHHHHHHDNNSPGSSRRNSVVSLDPEEERSSASSKPTPMEGIELTGAAASNHADPMVMGRNDLAKLRSKLGELVKKQSALLGQPDKLEEAKALLQQQKHLVEQIATLEASLKALQSSAELEKEKSTMTARQVPEFAVKGVTDCTGVKKPFKSVDAFLSYFKKILETNKSNPDTEWSDWLKLSFDHEYEVWYDSELTGKDLNWDGVCRVVRKRFVSQDSRVRKAIEVFNSTMKERESMQQYGMRFQNLAREAGLSNCDVLAMLFLLSLPSRLQDKVMMSFCAKPGNDDRLPDKLEEIVKLANSLSLAKRPHDDEDDGSRSFTKRHRRGQSTGKFFCYHHDDRCNHRSKECPLLNEPIDEDKKCYYAHHEFESGHDCRARREALANTSRGARKHNHKSRKNGGAKYKVNTMRADKAEHGEANSTFNHPGDVAMNDKEDLIPLEVLQSVDEDIGMEARSKFLCTAQLNVNPYVLKTPILIQNSRCLGLVDTGAEISVINKSLCDENKWSFTTVSGDIMYAGKDHSVKRIGITEPLRIRYNGRTLVHRFEVMELGHYNVILGFDLLPKLGIALQGVAAKWDDQVDHNVPDPSVHDSYKNLKPNESPAGTPEERSKFLRAIQPKLAANAKVSKWSFCNIAESVIRLELTDDVASWHRQYPLPYALKPTIDATIQRWIEEGVIMRAPENTAWNSPLTLADKKDAQGNKVGKRLCLDPRHINRHLKDDRYQLPTIKEIFHDLSGATVFTTLDLTNAFHRFKIHEDDRHITAFTYGNRQYVFRGCPFGLKPISSKFQRVMHILFYDMPFVRTFVDDIIIFSKDLSSHTQHVKYAIDALTRANLILNEKKCHFAQRSVYLLGFCISQHGISLDPRKVTNALDWPLPTTGKDVQRFMGLVNYFKDHICNLSKISAPLRALMHTGSLTKVWTTEHTMAMKAIKQELAKNVLLHFPNMAEPFYVATDASNHGIGAVLFQKIKGKDCIISFMARALSKSERNYSTTKRELLGIVFALQKFHPYLWSNPFTIYTDHKALTYLNTQKLANTMMLNWFDVLMDYQFDIIHLPGIENVLPDQLSRLFTPDEHLEGDKIEDAKDSKIKIGKLYTHDKRCIFHVRVLNREPTDVITPPEEERPKELERAHMTIGHAGAEHIVRYLRREGIYWTNLPQDAVEMVKKCPDCQKYNITRKGYHPLRPIYAYIPGDHWAIDLASFNKTSTKGNNFLLVMVDVCTRFCILRALPNKHSDTIVEALVQVFCDFGIPRVLQSDNGREFKNTIMKKLVESLGVHHRFTTPYHPRANGIAERWVQSATDVIRKKIEGAGNDWDYYVPSTQLELNMRVAKRLNTPPFSLMFARDMNAYRDYRKNGATSSKPMSHDELVERLQYMQGIVFPALKEKVEAYNQAMTDKFNSTHKLIDFPEQSHVMVRVQSRGSKLAPAFEGPYTVLRKTEGGTYVLQDETAHFTR
ncbi:hypothetical protein RO3G_15169 [Lichtheimia corymbifera JMRC:FSU:9682]|uniref:RNA-directed DNA polymerase n=1 Tax=Lichtheimia corymbifera JMRC:FSU:9682 TaxID=1263082 RepID=A0A068SEF2_9FUNG|nr:hypothetical protein RO3G_15169 [Lichtheimia corymbifera JMRC:FSU:9682]